MGYRVPAATPADEQKILRDVLGRCPKHARNLESTGDAVSFLGQLAELGASIGSGTLDVPYVFDDYASRARDADQM